MRWSGLVLSANAIGYGYLRKYLQIGFAKLVGIVYFYIGVRVSASVTGRNGAVSSIAAAVVGESGVLIVKSYAGRKSEIIQLVR